MLLIGGLILAGIAGHAHRVGAAARAADARTNAAEAAFEAEAMAMAVATTEGDIPPVKSELYARTSPVGGSPLLLTGGELIIFHSGCQHPEWVRAVALGLRRAAAQAF
jgi:hypothetical protein